MRSLLLRFFFSFWLVIGITIGTAVLAGYWYAERVREAFEEFDLGDSVLEASTALERDGRDGLKDWLESLELPPWVSVYVIDSDFDDLLERRLPRGIERIVDRHHRHAPQRRKHEHREPPNLLRARRLTQLIDEDGETYTVVMWPSRSGPWQSSRRPGGSAVLAIALIVSAIVSYLLARAITNPVRKLRDATIDVAGGNLDARVAPSMGSRRDEIGLLANDFDEMAEKLQRAAAQQTELSRNISHELRSPLARLRVALELARKESGDLPEFDKIDLEAERLDRLIGQILSYSRFESVDSDARKRIDLSDLVSSVVEDVNYECRSAGLEGVSVHALIADKMELDGYSEALISAIENVLRNAVHHSPADSKVSLSLSNDGSGNAVIEVSDAGSGVADHDLEHLFEPFFRTRSASEEKTQNGTGLGLAIARRAVELHEGEISAGNAAEGGLRITIVLPLRA